MVRSLNLRWGRLRLKLRKDLCQGFDGYTKNGVGFSVRIHLRGIGCRSKGAGGRGRSKRGTKAENGRRFFVREPEENRVSCKL